MRVLRTLHVGRHREAVVGLGRDQAEVGAEISDLRFEVVVPARASTVDHLRAARPGDPASTHLPERATLRRAEANILAYLAAHADRVVPQREIVERVLGGAHTSDTSLVRVHIASLRKKLGDARGVVRTARGRGYFLDSERLRRWRSQSTRDPWL
jgi:DNA-binding response OmpR family regulator